MHFFITGGLTLEITLYSCRKFGHMLTPRAILNTFAEKLFPNLRKQQSMISQIGKIVSTSDVDHSSTIPGDVSLALEALDTSKTARSFGVPM